MSSSSQRSAQVCMGCHVQAMQACALGAWLECSKHWGDRTAGLHMLPYVLCPLKTAPPGKGTHPCLLLDVLVVRCVYFHHTVVQRMGELKHSPSAPRLHGLPCASHAALLSGCLTVAAANGSHVVLRFTGGQNAPCICSPHHLAKLASCLLLGVPAC